MRKVVLFAGIVALDLLAAAWLMSSAVKAELDHDAAIPAAPVAMELVVLEAPGCIYCGLFRRDVLPSYEASGRAKEMPIRFVDINDAAADALGLDSPVDIVPTFVVLKNNHEVGRIPGYTGPEFFFHTINHLLSGAG
jgi:thioredoxin-related protein